MNNDPIISLEKVNIRLGGRIILDDINFSIQKGTFGVILGPNGAGKSTLLKLLLGLLKPTRGSITILGKKPTRGSNAVGYAPQHRILETDLALRARDVVGFGLDGNRWGIGFPSKKRDEIINKVLKEVDAFRFANAPIGQLSGGEQQRLLIAQALITNPQILLLDEPLSNLDITHGQEIISLLAKLTKIQGITILLVAHDINPLLPVVDKVLFLANGHSVIGGVDEVITSKTLSELYNTEVEVIKAKNRMFVFGAEI